jgi:hypothetical protein
MDRTDKADTWAGWLVFTAVLLIVIGGFNIIEGIFALIYNDRILLVAGRLVAVDLTGWGWTVLIAGVVMIAAGLGLFSAKTWARILAIIVVAIHALLQITWLGAYPIWSLLMIALDVVVLYALTARWSTARPVLNPESAQYDPSYGQHTHVG